MVSNAQTTAIADILISYMYSYCMEYPVQKEVIKDMTEYILHTSKSPILSKKIEWLISEISDK